MINILELTRFTNNVFLMIRSNLTMYNPFQLPLILTLFLNPFVFNSIRSQLKLILIFQWRISSKYFFMKKDLNKTPLNWCNSKRSKLKLSSSLLIFQLACYHSYAYLNIGVRFISLTLFHSKFFFCSINILVNLYVFQFLKYPLINNDKNFFIKAYQNNNLMIDDSTNVIENYYRFL
jgi:hypothetical protein